MKRMERLRERKVQYQVRKRFLSEHEIKETVCCQEEVNKWLRAVNEQFTGLERSSNYQGIGGNGKDERFPLRRPSSPRRRHRQAGEMDRQTWYECRGECYLHVMMDGEAIQERLYKRNVERVFELR